MTLGYRRGEIDEMTVADDLADLAAHWKHAPPPHVTLARVKALLCAYFGIDVSETSECPAPETLGAVDEETMRRQVAMMNGALA